MGLFKKKPKENVAAAAFLWAVLVELRWDEEDDPKDVELHRQLMDTAIRSWPWLDEAADIYRERAGVSKSDWAREAHPER